MTFGKTVEAVHQTAQHTLHRPLAPRHCSVGGPQVETLLGGSQACTPVCESVVMRYLHTHVRAITQNVIRYSEYRVC